MIKHLLVKWSICLAICISNISFLNAQIAANYEVGTWFAFKPAALTYSFDDNTSNQLSVAMPLFDKYGYKVSFNIVPGWSPDYAGFLNASKNGHEIASHTVSHATLSSLSAAAQDPELKNSQATINSNITNAKCLTIIYPNCNIGDVATMSKYYISGRTCSGQINANNLTDFWNISSIICGTQGVNTSQGFNDKATQAKGSKGWCVFLIHGIDGQGSYSPLASSVLSPHVDWVKANEVDYWVANQLQVVKYIKERTAAKLVETTLTTDSLQAVITDGIDNTIYDAALSFRRVIPSAWAGAKVYLGTTLLTSTKTTVNGVNYVNFNVAPDKGNVYIVNTASAVAVTAPTVTSPVTYCQNVIASALTATGSALKWYTVATGGTALTSAPIPSTSTIGSTTYYVSQTVNGVESSRSSIVVTINALPTISAGSAVSICNGLATTLTATGGTSYKWNNGITTASNTISPTITTTFTVTGTNSSSCSAISSVIVTVNAVPTAPSVNSSVSYAQGATASVLSATGTAIKWYTVATGGTALTSAPTPLTTTVGTTNYFVSQTTNTCESSRAVISVDITAPIVKIPLHVGWNYIGCPINGTTALASALSSIWANVLVVKNLDVFYSSSNVPALNTLTNVEWGQGYFIKVSTACDLDWIAQ